MKQILIKIVLLAIVFAVNSVFSQSLNEIIQVALEKNYQISIVKNEAKIASNNNVLGNTGILPSVGVNGAYSNSFNNTRQEFADGTVREGNFARNTNLNLSLLANWTVFNGFSVYAKQDQLSYLEEFGALNTKFYLEQTISDIVTTYHEIAFEKQVLLNYKKSLEISSFRLRLEEKRKEIGSNNAVDYGQAIVDYQTDSIRFLDQEARIQTLVYALNNTLNEDLEKEVSISETRFYFLAMPSRDSLLEQANAANKMLAKQVIEELISETELRLAKASRSPRIDLFGGVEYAKTSAAVGFVNSNQNYGPTVGVRVSFNLFNGGETNRAIANRQIENENKQITKSQVTKQIQTDVLTLYTKYQAVSAQIALAKNNVTEMRKVSEVAKEQFSKGAINGYDFRLTQLSLLNAEITLYQVEFSLKMLEISLNRLSGKILESYM